MVAIFVKHNLDKRQQGWQKIRPLQFDLQGPYLCCFVLIIH